MPNERIRRIQAAMRVENIDTLICALPADVLLLSGYWPVIGSSFAVVTAEGACAVLAPEDEEELARNGWAGEVATDQPASLKEIRSVADAAGSPLRALIKKLGAHCTRVGYERGAASEPASYAAMHLFGAEIIDLLRVAAPS